MLNSVIYRAIAAALSDESIREAIAEKIAQHIDCDLLASEALSTYLAREAASDLNMEPLDIPARL